MRYREPSLPFSLPKPPVLFWHFAPMTFSYSLLTSRVGLVWTPSHTPRSPGTLGMCVSLSSTANTKSTSLLTSTHTLSNPLSLKKEKSRVIGQKLVVSVIRGVGPTKLSVKSRVFLWLERIQLQLPASPSSVFARNQRAFNMRKLSPSPTSELRTVPS